MKTNKNLLSLLLFVVAFSLNGFGQIKIVEDDYQLNLGSLEEIQLKDLESELNFEFSVGDSVYVLESTHKMLCFNKHTKKFSNKPFKTGPYVVTGICFGDSIDQFHEVVDKCGFDKEDDRRVTHAKIYGWRIVNGSIPHKDNILECVKHNEKTEQCEKYALRYGYCFAGDTTSFLYNDKYFGSDELLAFYESDKGKKFLQSMDKEIRRLKERVKSGEGDLPYYTEFTIKTIVYKMENKAGDVFYVDNREIAFLSFPEESRNMTFIDEYPCAKKVLLIKVSDYNKKRNDLVGKDFYLGGGGYDVKDAKDYMSGKKINIKIVSESGTMLNDAMLDDMGLNSNNHKYEVVGNMQNYYRCKDFFIRKGEFIIILSDANGEFSAKLIGTPDDGRSGHDYDDCYVISTLSPRELFIVPKEVVDFRIQDWMMSEKDRQLKQQKAQQESIARQKKHDAEIIAKYGEKWGNMILQHKVAIGMNKEMCREAGWYPRDTFTTTTSRGVSEVWVINYKTALYFADGVLYMIEN